MFEANLGYIARWCLKTKIKPPNKQKHVGNSVGRVCLAFMKLWVGSPSSNRLGMVVPACNPGAWEIEAGVSEV